MSTTDNRPEDASRFLHLLRERAKNVARVLEEESEITLEGDTLHIGFVFPDYVRHHLEPVTAAAEECWGRPISIEVAFWEPAKEPAEPTAGDDSKKPSTSPQTASGSSARKAAATTNHAPPVQLNRATRRRAQHDLAKIEQTLHRFCRNGDIVEIRALKVAPRSITVAGYFDADHLAEAARLLTNNNREAAGIYITLNPPKRDLLARAENRLVERPDFSATSDGDIDRRKWLFIDFDPKRPSGISATDAEKAAAAKRTEECRQHLAELGWVKPVVADSGNGAHLLYPIAEPNDGESRVLIERVLKSLALTFSDNLVDVDISTFNAARITKLYGTVAAKGDSTIERPHRVSAILEDPQLRPGEVVTREQLAALASLLPEEPARPFRASATGKEFDLADWILKYNLPVRGPLSYGSDLKWLGLHGDPCLLGGPHDSGGFFLIKRTGGPIQAGCHHQSCQGMGWRELRQRYEPDAYTRTFESSGAVPTVASGSQALSPADALVLPEVFIRNKIQVLNWQELGERRRTHVQNWVVKGWLARGENSTWWGKVEHGKTTIMRELTMCVLRGELFLGHECIAGRVFYAMLDADTEDLVYDEFEKIGMNDSDLPNIKFMFEPMLARMENGPEQFFRALYEWHPDLVIIDPLARLQEIKDFNDYNVTYLMAMVAQYARLVDAHFALPGHIPRGRPPGAAAATAGQGSIAFGAGANARFVVERKEGTDIYVVRTSKGKSAGFEALEGDHVLELDPVTSRVSLGKPFKFGQQASALKEQVFEFLEGNPDQEWSAAAIAKEIHTTSAIARLAANMLHDDKRVDRSGTGKKGNPFLFTRKSPPKNSDLGSFQREIFRN
jgi:hypothetical protein